MPGMPFPAEPNPIFTRHYQYKWAIEAAVLATNSAETKRGKAKTNWGPEAAVIYRQLQAAAKLGVPVPVPSKGKGGLAAYIRHWFNKWNLRPSITPPGHPGRPFQLPEAAVALCLGFVKASAAAGTPFATQAEANNSCLFKFVLNKFKVTAKTLWDRMHEMEPQLGKTGTVEFKKELSPELCQQRLDTCKAWLGRGINQAVPYVYHCDFLGIPVPPIKRDEWYFGMDGPYFLYDRDGVPLGSPAPTLFPPSDWLTDWAKNIIWVDAKTVYICPKSYKVWTVGRQDLPVVEDLRVLGDSWCIKYYAAVNFRTGALLLKLVSGTHGAGYEHPLHEVS